MTQKPCEWEGDYRLYESLAAGAAVLVDPPDRTFDGAAWGLGPAAAAGGGGGRGGHLAAGNLRHGEHAAFFDPTSRAAFRAALEGLLPDAAPTGGPADERALRRRFRLARTGHLEALRRHRSVSRVDGAMKALAETWAMWPQGLLAQIDASAGAPTC